METLEVKKLEKKVNLDTTTEACWNDCYSHKFVEQTSYTT